MKIIVTGGRAYHRPQTVDRILNALDPTMLVVGDCPTGADYHAREWAKRQRAAVGDIAVDLRVYVADWQGARKAGNVKTAGPVRNGWMVAENRDAAFLLAFPGGSGTASCIRKAMAAGMPVLKVG